MPHSVVKQAESSHVRELVKKIENHRPFVSFSLRVILHETLPAYCAPNVVRMETGEVKNEKVYASPRPPPKDLLET